MNASILLPGDLLAEIRPAGAGDSSFQLLVNGVPQSHVDLENPSVLLYEYAAYVGNIFDATRPSPDKILHLGGGALTLARYIAWRKPRVKQLVVELYEDLIPFVLDTLPLRGEVDVSAVFGDARDLLAKPTGGLSCAFDLVIADVFQGARTPKHLTTKEFLALCLDRLSRDGLLLLNLPIDSSDDYARSSVASLLSFGDPVGVVIRPEVMKAESSGHAVAFISSPAQVTRVAERLTTILDAQATLLMGSDLDRWVGDAEALTDSSAKDADGSVSNLAQAVRDKRRQRKAASRRKFKE